MWAIYNGRLVRGVRFTELRDVSAYFRSHYNTVSLLRLALLLQVLLSLSLHSVKPFLLLALGKLLPPVSLPVMGLLVFLPLQLLSQLVAGINEIVISHGTFRRRRMNETLTLPVLPVS